MSEETTMIEHVDADRLRELTLELVSIGSPTGDTAEVSRRYAQRLEEIGMVVEVLDEVFPATPIVIGRLAGGRPGPSVVLNGHLDTVPIPHAPARIENGSVVGRGSADMKGALACAAETARVLKQSGPFPGELVIIAIGLHEAPGGRGEDLTWLLREHGFRSDYAVVCELSGDSFIVAHMGTATFEITVSRSGMVTHELKTPKGTPHPIMAAGRVLGAIASRNEELAATEHPWVGAETYFVGEVLGGDFYNRHPNTCRIVGIRRWAPGNTLAAVEAEFRALLEPVAAETGCAIAVDMRLVRDSYAIDPEHSLAIALRAGYRDVTGLELAPTGIKVVADAAVFQAEAGIPTVYHGPAGTGAHADVESMPVAELVRATKVYLRLLEHLWA
jgi:acetylornithine deacetylase/succinyl-diaminopimelate desuccinylase-like protein